MEKVNSGIDVSVILPCYNEAAILEKTVDIVRAILKKSVFRYEIIIAQDKSTDGTDKIAEELSRKFNDILWLRRENRRGRGSAISEAIRKASGTIVGFIDIDLETPAHYIYPLILEVEKGADIVTCVRVFKLTKRQLFFRMPKVLSHYVYLWLVRKVLGIKLQDTEAGFKFFNRQRILPLLDEIKDEHWFWDTEIMVRAYFKGYTIKEVSTLFIPDYTRRSKVNLLKDSCDYLTNLFRFRKEFRKSYKKA